MTPTPLVDNKCLVNNSVTTMETSFLMNRKVIIVVKDTVEYTNTLLYWYSLASGELQVVLVLESSRQCESLNVSTQHS